MHTDLCFATDYDTPSGNCNDESNVTTVYSGHIGDNIDLYNSGIIGKHLLGEIEKKDIKKLIVNCHRLNYMDSTGVAMFIYIFCGLIII